MEKMNFKTVLFFKFLIIFLDRAKMFKTSDRFRFFVISYGHDKPCDLATFCFIRRYRSHLVLGSHCLSLKFLTSSIFPLFATCLLNRVLSFEWAFVFFHTSIFDCFFCLHSVLSARVCLFFSHRGWISLVLSPVSRPFQLWSFSLQSRQCCKSQNRHP